MDSFLNKKVAGILVVATFFLFVKSSLVFGLEANLPDKAQTIELNLREGVRYYDMGSMDEAKVFFEKVLQEDPNNEEAKSYVKNITLNKLGQSGSFESDRDLSMQNQGPEDAPNPPDDVFGEGDYSKPESIASKQDGPVKDETSNKMGTIEKERDVSTTKSSGIVKKVNDHISPFKISGQYRINFGVEGTDFTMKKSNPDYSERNWRLIYGKDLENTFDPQIFNKFTMNLDLDPESEDAYSGWGFHMNVTVDPWSYTAKGKKTTIKSSLWGNNYVTIQPKYWCGDGLTMGETLVTSLGDTISLPSLGVKHGKTQATFVDSAWGDRFYIPEVKMEEMFNPVRELWMDYGADDLKLRVFPFAYENQAMNSDDPLNLCNRHTYWMPSPWIYSWQPGQVIVDYNPNRVVRGTWSSTDAFYTRDGDYRRITELRGMSVKWYPEIAQSFGDDPEEKRTSVEGTVATPKGLWDDYDTFNTMPGAVRMKHKVTENWILGTLYSFNYGFNESKIDAEKHNVGVDLTFFPASNLKLSAETATGFSKFDKELNSSTSKNYDERRRGYVYYVSGEYAYPNFYDSNNKKKPFFESKVFWSHMDKGFDPALSSFRYTRRDEPWGRYVAFSNPHDSTTWVSDDILAFRIGDGIDQGRDVVNAQGKFNILDDKIDTLIYFRNVDHTDGSSIEKQLRNETSYKFNTKLRFKTILFYQWMPEVTRDSLTDLAFDPFIYDYDTDELLRVYNPAGNDMLGKDPSIGSFAGGFQYDINSKTTIEFVYERTNDWTDFPRGLLNNSFYGANNGVYYGSDFQNNISIWEPRSFLYKQEYFDLPPYAYYNIFRGKIYLHPVEPIFVTLKGTYNENEFAGAIDDKINHVAANIKYVYNKQIEFGASYMYSKTVDMARLVDSSEKVFNGHHNVWLGVRCKVRDSGVFKVEYGEHFIYRANLTAGTNPYTGFPATLDTAHIIRVTYTEDF